MSTGSGDSLPDEGARKPRAKGRVDYAEAASAGRAVLFAANRMALNDRQHRVLSAVIALTALYSRVEDRVYLAQIAAFAHGVEDAPTWMLKRTREALVELGKRGLVVTLPPRGRPPSGHQGPAYWIALGTPIEDPGTEVLYEARKGPPLKSESDPGTGPEQTPAPVQNRPPSRSRTDLGTGPPALKASEQAPEEPGEESRRGRTSAANGIDVDSPGARHTASPSIAELRGEFVGTLLELYDDDPDALLVGRHLRGHLPDAELGRLCAELEVSPPATVRLVLRSARQITDETGVNWPRLDLPPLASNGTRAR